MKTKFIITLMAFLMAFSLSAQEANHELTKKEKKQAKKEQRRLEREAHKQAGFELLKNKDFVLRVDRASNAKTGRMVTLPSLVNFVKIDGDNVTVQFGDISTIGLNGVGGVTYEGILQKFDTYDRGEGKAAGVMIQYTSLRARNLITLTIEINGDQVSARFNDNGTIINLYGFYESYSGSAIWEAQNRRDF